jgi:hypothetical protein
MAQACSAPEDAGERFKQPSCSSCLRCHFRRRRPFRITRRPRSRRRRGSGQAARDSLRVDERARPLRRRRQGVVSWNSVGSAPCLRSRGGKTTPASGCRTAARANSRVAGGAGQPEDRRRRDMSRTPGFSCDDGEKGQIYFRLFSYVRYLNQRNIEFVLHGRRRHTVQQRQMCSSQSSSRRSPGLVPHSQVPLLPVRSSSNASAIRRRSLAPAIWATRSVAS